MSRQLNVYHTIVFISNYFYLNCLYTDYIIGENATIHPLEKGGGFYTFPPLVVQVCFTSSLSTETRCTDWSKTYATGQKGRKQNCTGSVIGPTSSLPTWVNAYKYSSTHWGLAALKLRPTAHTLQLPWKPFT